MMYVFMFIGAFFINNGLLVLSRANITLGSFLTLGLGIVFLCVGILWNKIKELTRNGVWKTVKIIVICLCCAELLLVGFIAIYGETDTVCYNEDAVIVLGAGVKGDKVTLPLKMRLDKAVEIHKKNPDALIVVTGGKGHQEDVTEAYAMEKYLLEQGVDKDVIIKEEKATSTNENLKYSKQLLDSRLEGDYNITIVTNGFHIYRSVSIAKDEGFKNITHMQAGLKWYNYSPCYLRESLAVLKMWVFG
ncbi:MAG: YdcF family protein [Clostridia bacterium]|nr:YdcF family protein [Clostridia bacterium]